MTHSRLERRACYDSLRAQTNSVFPARPVLFSPAAQAQDPALGSRVYFDWTPLLVPYEYSNWARESAAHTSTCYIGDWTSIGKLAITGPDAHRFLSYVGIGNLATFAIGQAKHHVQVDAQGRIASEGLLYRTADEEFFYTGGGTDWTAWQLRCGDWQAQAQDRSAELFIFEIQGPASIHVLEKAFGQSLRDLQFNCHRPARLAGLPVRLLRTGISGELGYEVHGECEHAAAVWSTIVEAGRDCGIRQLGMRSQLVAHIEAGIATVGLDYLPSSIMTPGAQALIPTGQPGGSYIPSRGIEDYFRHPAELGWGARASLSSHEFLGRDALARLAAEGGPSRRLLSLEWDSEDIAKLFSDLFGPGELPEPMQLPREVKLSADRVLIAGQDVGISTSRTYSTSLRKMISLCVIDRTIEVNTPVIVLWGSPGTAQREIRAITRATPMKPDRRRQDVRNLTR